MRFFPWIVVGIATLLIGAGSPTFAQSTSLPTWNLPATPNLLQNSEEGAISGCVRLDGRCLFHIADLPGDLAVRTAGIEKRLNETGRAYFDSDAEALTIRTQQSENLQDIYLAVGEKEVRLMSVTSLDAQLQGVDIQTRADQIGEKLEFGLERAKHERTVAYLTRQGAISVGIGAIAFAVIVALIRASRRLRRQRSQRKSSAQNPAQPLSTQLSQRRKNNLDEVRYRLLQLGQAGTAIGATLLILNLFPYTRIAVVWSLFLLYIPVRIGIVAWGTYVLIRLSYAAINWLVALLAPLPSVAPDVSFRLQQRMTTILGVAKSVVTIALIGSGALVALLAVGINITPILAGAGIIGLAVSFASQSIIKDALNGFLIVVEDQYAVGDVITVGDHGGLVENLNLRLTQLRDAEGRLISIPNSEIKIVANHSSNWSRADLLIPVAYNTDVEVALELVERVALSMSEDEAWRNLILEPPLVLGVDDFADRGMMIRLWLKTQPLKQWDVSRELRRRVKKAFDAAEIALPALTFVSMRDRA